MYPSGDVQESAHVSREILRVEAELRNLVPYTRVAYRDLTWKEDPRGGGRFRICRGSFSLFSHPQADRLRHLTQLEGLVKTAKSLRCLAGTS